jgi:hypothetical protein
MNDEERRLTELVRKAVGDRGPFRPFAGYDDINDRIIGVVRDCSVTEVRVIPSLVLMEDNHPTSDDDFHVGFAVECVSRYCPNTDLTDPQILQPALIDGILIGIAMGNPRRVDQIFAARMLLAKIRTEGSVVTF